MCCQVPHTISCTKVATSTTTCATVAHMTGPEPVRRRRAPRKTDEERGRLGAWLYQAMDFLDVSDAQVAIAVGASAVTIRKIAGGSNRNPSPRLLWDIHQMLAAVAAEKKKPLSDPPGLPTASPRMVPDQSDLARAIEANTEMLKQLLDALIDRMPAQPDRLVLERVVKAVQLGQIRIPEEDDPGPRTSRKTPSPQKPAPANRGAAKRPKPQPDGAKG